jgi:hypothetical protein
MQNIVDIEKLSSDIQTKVLECDDTIAIDILQSIIDKSGMRGFFGAPRSLSPTGIVLDYDIDTVKSILKGDVK